MAKLVEQRTNADWVASLRDGDERALLDLRKYLCRSLHKVLSGRAGQNDVEDFAQQGVARVLDSLDQFRGDSRFTTWASAIAVRIAFTELRRKRWGDVSLDELMERGAFTESATPPTGATQSAHHEIVHALREAIRHALTDRQRKVVVAELESMPLAVLCEQLDMSRGAVYKMHFDARKKLRQYLEAKGFTLEDVRFVLDGESNTS